ncbi:Phosphoethanolamine transferase EptA specific for the 1 phosphate group of core-lipid A [Methylomonas albis]|uniref:Phosphoethanolamine--lipid A transferase n=1 Tax=Methylomonas albis TaxID=1854563 RepID=A0ABR9D5Z5_9GAMM|nr:phosphoethanolamine--lipid A transferase [Methylomonas albis]MBD9358500.1 phosphoethanolamine--lipid A transferase [Methylomonas albis]CAD6881914.1 Phosphoethanolamine transferase EptA specific for the 1 phosphate group of core-lipid A [Methylomonas albis]
MNQSKLANLFPPALLVSLFMAVFCNMPLWRKLLEVKGGLSLNIVIFYAPFFIVLIALLVLFFTVFRFKYLFKGTLIFFLLATSLIEYFMLAYDVVIDKTMLQNALETNPKEALELVNIKMFLYIIVLGIIPSIFIWNRPAQYYSFLRQLAANAKTLLICAVTIFITSYFFYGDYTSVYRNNREIRYLITPVNLVDSSISNVSRIFKSNHPLVVVGNDANLSANRNHSTKKNLTILVIGETARAANFSLDGYGRQTNPLLSQEHIINFSQAYSCGTATAASVPCMFSNFGREHFDSSKAKYTENLLDVLSHAGISVLWRNNNDSCKGVCSRVTYEDMAHLNLNDLCNDEVCYDEVLLLHLQEYLDKQNQDGVIVLHQQGSHGPGYNLRHPQQFKVFTPECDKATLNDCSQQELVNAYDNTIIYTDFFLKNVIDFLKKNNQKYNSAMFYVSDHGESLGEKNVYLHGLPYFIAPDEQKHVPMLSWFSDGFIQNNHIDIPCLNQHSARPVSHDNLFHSILGLMGVATQVYNASLDIFAECRNNS